MLGFILIDFVLDCLQVVSRVPCATPAEMKAAADAASEAFKTWSQSSVMTRQQLMFKFQQLIKDNMVSRGLFFSSKDYILEINEGEKKSILGRIFVLYIIFIKHCRYNYSLLLSKLINLICVS